MNSCSIMFYFIFSFSVLIANNVMQWFKELWWLWSTLKSVFSSRILPAPVSVRQIPEGPDVPSVSDVKASDCFVDLWKYIDIQQLIPNSGFSQMPYDLYCIKAKVLKQKWRTGYLNNATSFTWYCGIQASQTR